VRSPELPVLGVGRFPETFDAGMRVYEINLTRHKADSWVPKAHGPLAWNARAQNSGTKPGEQHLNLKETPAGCFFLRQKFMPVSLNVCNRVSGDSKHGTPQRYGWEQWLVEHAPRLLLFARQQARSEADAQDLLQEAVLESWRRQADHQPPPLALVFATIRRRAVDLARSSDRRAHREANSLREIPPCWFDQSAEDRERARMIDQAMHALPDIYRETVTLKIWGGLTFAEIAEALHIPQNTAASRYRYGLVELRKLTREALT
jgi:RNA polymerase sigma-70 factor (ECF subfamily)